MNPEIPTGVETEHIVTFTYRNYLGEVEKRHVIPRTISFGATPWHPAPQWMMHGWDLDKKAQRSFAISDITQWSPLAAAAAQVPHDG